VTGPSVAQSTSGSGSGTGLQSSKSLSGAPTAGNLLVAGIFTGNGTSDATITIDTSKWFFIDRAIGDTDTDMVITLIGRYVQIGDTAAMPAFCTAGSTFFAYTVQEIQGVNGTWANDFQSVRYVQALSATSLTTPTDTTRSANCLGLLIHGKYNRSANAGVDAGWTSDVNTNNSGNYGSFGCAHKAVASANTQISATNTFQAGGDTGGMIQLILNGGGAAPTVPYVVRLRHMVNSASGHPGSIGFGGDPLSGHSLLAFIGWQDGTSAAPTLGGSWTLDDQVLNGSNPILESCYRDVSGDTRALAALTTAGTQLWWATVLELGGMTGAYATDKVTSKKHFDTTGATITTTSDTTNHTNQIIITAFTEYNGTTLLSDTGADLDIEQSLNNTKYGAWGIAETFKASSGASVSSVWTKSTSALNTGYIQIRLGAQPATETATGTMAFGAMALADSGVVSRAGTVGMAFGGIAMSGVAVDTPKTGNVQIIVVAG